MRSRRCAVVFVCVRVCVCVCVCVHVQKICTEINNEELLYSTKNQVKKEAIYELRQECGVRMLSQLVIGDRKLATC